MIDEKNQQIVLSEINILPIKPNNGLVAIGSVVINNCLFLGSIGVHIKPNGRYRILFPTKKIGNRDIHIYHPINRMTGNAIEKAIVEKCEVILERSDDRHNQNRTQDE